MFTIVRPQRKVISECAIPGGELIDVQHQDEDGEVGVETDFEGDVGESGERAPRKMQDPLRPSDEEVANHELNTFTLQVVV